MNVLKKVLLQLSPACYAFLRNHYQFAKLKLSGKLKVIESKNQALSGLDSTFDFVREYLYIYQIKSEILSLIELLQKIQPTTYLEIGTADGGTHFLIRRLCSSIEKSVAIDIDIKNRLLIDRLTNTLSSNYISGYSTSAFTQEKMAKLFPEEGSIDVCFIDGDHSYDGVKNDFELYRKYVRSGGLIIFHDIVEDWGQRYGKDTNKFTGGVPKFFDEIKDAYQHKTFVENTKQDGYGIGVLFQP